MKQWISIAVILILVGLVAGLLLTYLSRMRVTSEQAHCKNNLREIGLFALHHTQKERGEAPDLPTGVNADRLVSKIPAGTIVLRDISPERRLSWYVEVLPGLNPRRLGTAELLAGIDRSAPWDAPTNQQAARAKLAVLLCPALPPLLPPDVPSPTSYLGIAGRGEDTASRPLSTRSGCFRYDEPTSFDAIRDGTSQTFLLGERALAPGPWLRGGSATVRGLDDQPNASPILGAGAQFGGYHPFGANWGFADGSVRFFTDRTTPNVLLGLATIAGQDNDFTFDEN